MTFQKTPQFLNSIVITDANSDQIHEYKTILEVSTYWHKFIIDNVYGLRRNTVLKILYAHIRPLEMIALCYTEEAEGAHFFARMCKEAVLKLCKDNLIVPNSVNPFKLKIILRYSSTDVVKVNLTKNIQGVLQKRLKSDILRLSHFADDPDLSEYVPLSQRKLLAFVLNTSKNLRPKVIKLCGNEIKSLDAFQIMPPTVEGLDLRHNVITDLEELKNLSNFKISELWLEGNPLCGLYDEYNYVQKVTNYCPQIEKLDGFLLRQNGFPSFRRNFLCNVTSYDVVDQFLGEFFPAYDAKNLEKLETLYHGDALFSMTTEFLSSHPYNKFSRNLKSEVSNKHLYIGGGEIARLLSQLPQSEHDPYTFTVDVLVYTVSCAIIVVSGVFREIPKTDRILGFNRYFVLENRNNKYRISNEQFHVCTALSSQKVNAFKSPSVLEAARDSTQQILMVDTFVNITTLTKEWAKMFLEECHYNLKHAVLLFIDLYKRDKIPTQSFTSSN